MFTLHHGDCLDVMALCLPDNSVDAIVTDPPYGLSFMGKKWDYDVPPVEVWAECLRVLKPGGHLLAFAGTRTQHRMAVRIEDAGFEIRDMIAWVYGCLSEDTEILTENGWMLYNKAKHERVLAYDVQADIYQWEKPSRWNEYRVESDTAYRIQSDYTDQIVSRGHRCLVERGGELLFVPADELAGMERVPYLRSDISTLPQGRGELLLKDVLRKSEGLAQAALGKRQWEEATGKWACSGEKPGVERGSDLLQAQGQVREPVNQVRSLPCGTDRHGAQGRLCDGAPACCGNGNWQATDEERMCAPHQPRCNGQQNGEPDAICDQCGSQEVRARASYQTTVATVTAIEYSGLIWCPTVSTGAFVARRNGKVFITGNSGFPKSLDVSKAIDKAAGAEREVIGRSEATAATGGVYGEYGKGFDITAPATDAARQWQGWGPALKPALEPITVARKPLIGTVAENVQRFGTGALNVDGCRVGNETRTNASKPRADRNGFVDGFVGGTQSQTHAHGRWPANLIHDGSDEVVGLFPQSNGAGGSVPNVKVTGYGDGIGTGKSEYFGGERTPFESGKGSAARFFYCAKASKKDRDEGLDGFEERLSMRYGEQGQGPQDKQTPRKEVAQRNHHPTVKPTDLMRYICRLVTPPGGTVLDPFNGSGSTGKGAILEGFRYIGIEREAEYVEIARARIQAVMPAAPANDNTAPAQADLFSV